MIRRSDRNARRILNFPAVHPCEGVSPSTLLESLIGLSRTICGYRAKFTATHQRNARETIRQVGVLRVFFEEIRDRGSSLPASAVLSFAELHVAFQKIRFLLEDCTREGSRVWILAKSRAVATKFRALAREVATALDVLPMDLIDVNREVREVVELVARQAREANRMELGVDDEMSLMLLRRVINRLEGCISPARDDLKRILDHLGIHSWTECDEEIEFLEAEIDFQNSNDDDDDRDRDQKKEKEAVPLTLLCSLAALMNYCRAVMFETFDNCRSVDQHRLIEGSNLICNPLPPRINAALTCLNPRDFRCPISLDLMTDPVTVSTGQTYDRASIQKWLKSGRHVCPKTGESLATTDLVPNSALQSVIQQYYGAVDSTAKSWKQSRRSNTVVSGIPAAEEASRLLAKFLAATLASGGASTLQKKSKAAFEIRLLAKSSVFNLAHLIEGGAVPPLLNLLTSTDSSAQENAVSALLRLSKHPLGQGAIIDGHGLRNILVVLRKGAKLKSRQNAAATLFYLASVEESRRVIGETPRAIPALVSLIRDGTSCGKKNAVVAIFALLLSPSNHRRVIVAGAVPLLLDLLATTPSGRTDLATDALAVLASLAEGCDGAAAMKMNSALTPVTSVLRSSSSRTEREYCASILLSMCANGGAEVVEDLARDGSIMAALYTMLTEGSAHARGKARSLIKMLQGVRETTTLGLFNPSAA